jgi:hypothetical protein
MRHVQGNQAQGWANALAAQLSRGYIRRAIGWTQDCRAPRYQSVDSRRPGPLVRAFCCSTRRPAGDCLSCPNAPSFGSLYVADRVGHAAHRPPAARLRLVGRNGHPACPAGTDRPASYAGRRPGGWGRESLGRAVLRMVVCAVLVVRDCSRMAGMRSTCPLTRPFYISAKSRFQTAELLVRRPRHRRRSHGPRGVRR